MDSKEEDVESSNTNLKSQDLIPDVASTVKYDVARALRCREQALKELVDTEKTYVDGLGKLVE